MTTNWGTSHSASFTGTDGNYYCIKLDCKDAVSNTASFYSANNILYDITAPVTTLNIGSPKYGTSPTYVKSTTEFTLSPEDNAAGVASTQYKIDDASYGAYSSAFTESSAGAHTIYYYSTDNAGNTESANSDSVFVDDIAPETTDNSDTSWHANDQTITLSPSDAGSNVANT